MKLLLHKDHGLCHQMITVLKVIVLSACCISTLYRN